MGIKEDIFGEFEDPVTKVKSPVKRFTITSKSNVTVQVSWTLFNFKIHASYLFINI